MKERTKDNPLWTGHIDKNGVLIMKGDRVKQEGLRSGYYNNQDRIITLGKGRFDDCINMHKLYAMGYYSRGNEVIL